MSQRRNGNTTRKLDRAVQELFENDLTYLYERCEDAESTEKQTDLIYNKFNSRMRNEHPDVIYNVEYGTFSGILAYKVTTKDH